MATPRKFELSAKQRARLGALLEEQGLAVAAEQRIPRRPDLDAQPLSFAQRRLWFLDQLRPGTPAYNVPAALRVRGRLNRVALQRGLEEIVRRHEPLRTTFEAIDGEPRQRVHASNAVPIAVTDLSHLPETDSGSRTPHSSPPPRPSGRSICRPARSSARRCCASVTTIASCS